MKGTLVITFIISLFFSTSVLAQKSCLNTLREAKELYEQGLINEIPQLLSAVWSQDLHALSALRHIN
jgi:cobalamin biosynthesis protein CobD/CbiB